VAGKRRTGNGPRQSSLATAKERQTSARMKAEPSGGRAAGEEARGKGASRCRTHFLLRSSETRSSDQETRSGTGVPRTKEPHRGTGAFGQRIRSRNQRLRTEELRGGTRASGRRNCKRDRSLRAKETRRNRPRPHGLGRNRLPGGAAAPAEATNGKSGGWWRHRPPSAFGPSDSRRIGRAIRRREGGAPLPCQSGDPAASGHRREARRPARPTDVCTHATRGTPDRYASGLNPWRRT
jgi:hypothetical protein